MENQQLTKIIKGKLTQENKTDQKMTIETLFEAGVILVTLLENGILKWKNSFSVKDLRLIS